MDINMQKLDNFIEKTEISEEQQRNHAKKLIYRSKYRSNREIEKLLSPIVEYIPAMYPGQLRLCEIIISLDDDQLQQIIGQLNDGGRPFQISRPEDISAELDLDAAQDWIRQLEAGFSKALDQPLFGLAKELGVEKVDVVELLSRFIPRA